MPEAPSNRNVMIVLAYLWPLAFVPLLFDKGDPEVQWHAKHGIVLMVAELVLLIAELVVAFVYMIMLSVVGFGWLGLAVVLALISVWVWIAILGVHTVAILKGINGGRLSVPGVSVYASRF